MLFKKNDLISYIEYLKKWIKDSLLSSSCSGFVVGLSGGIDSSVVGLLAHQSLPGKTHFLVLPIGDMGQDLEDVKQLANRNDLKFEIHDLTESFLVLSKRLNLKSNAALTNLKARLRMVTIYAIAQERNLLVLGTDNLAEYYLGYFTKFGDGACDLMPISRLLKGDVFEAGRLLGVNENILRKAPSAALFAGQTDEGELGFRYKDFEDFFLGKEIESSIYHKIVQQILKTEHKRNPPTTPEIFNERELGFSERIKVLKFEKTNS